MKERAEQLYTHLGRVERLPVEQNGLHAVAHLGLKPVLAGREVRDSHCSQRQPGTGHRRTAAAPGGKTQQEASGYKGFLYQAASWKAPRRVVAKVEHHAGELFPRVGFMVTNWTLPSRAVVRFYNKRGTAEQWIKEGKQAVKMTRLSCHRFRSNEVRLWLSVIAYNLGNLWRRLVLPRRIANWSLTSLQQRLGPTYQSTITYTYDAGNRLTQVVDSVSGRGCPEVSRFPGVVERAHAVGRDLASRQPGAGATALRFLGGLTASVGEPPIVGMCDAAFTG